MGGMRIAALLLMAALVAGCSNTAVSVGGGAPPSGPVAPPGSAKITTGSGTAALGLMLTFGVIDYINNPQPFPNPAVLFSPGPPPAPEMASGRRISEQDCSKPVDLTLGNLRCK
jgi:hypothetical protein